MSLTKVKVYQRNSKPFGVTFDEWSVRWWQWLLMIPKSISPAHDLTGKNASVGQLGPSIFFLCQTIEGAKEQPIRRISIARGASVFMPILNWISNFYEHGTSEKELIDIAKQKMDIIGNLEFRLNGEDIKGLEKYRFLTKFFVVELPKENILDLPAGKARLISDGYWVFTRPILNDITISTYGSCSSGITKIGVNYDIKVI
jgi:hypothetical protein